jgi:hypothetical protein
VRRFIAAFAFAFGGRKKAAINRRTPNLGFAGESKGKSDDQSPHSKSAHVFVHSITRARRSCDALTAHSLASATRHGLVSRGRENTMSGGRR